MIHRVKIFNDPVYGFVTVPSDLIYDLIEHPYFQRLRRIKQLGMAEYVYPGALHTRFHHALGAMHLMGQALQTLQSKGNMMFDAEIEAAAKLADAHDFIMNLPDRYDTVLGERGNTLSGGQRQRIAIARAAIRKAPIVILDEPTTGLDNASEQAVNQALNRLTQGSTTFLISHNLPAVEHADIILYVEGGQILERGTHRELMQLGERYAALYQLQSTNQNDRHQGEQNYACRA